MHLRPKGWRNFEYLEGPGNARMPECKEGMRGREQHAVCLWTDERASGGRRSGFADERYPGRSSSRAKRYERDGQRCANGRRSGKLCGSHAAIAARRGQHRHTPIG